MSNEELACVYAALICIDDDVTVTGDKILAILKAANVRNALVKVSRRFYSGGG